MDAYKKKYRKDNVEKIAARQKQYNNENSEYQKQLRKDNYKQYAEYQKKYREKNPGYQREYMKNRRNVDPTFRLIGNLRHRLWLAIKGNVKSAGTMKLIGCTIEHLMLHLEGQFSEGMTWNNYGEWHIDHIIPCASFDLSKEESQRKCFNYRNLQPLWAKDNLRKSNKIPRGTGKEKIYE